MQDFLTRLWRDEDGQDIVEYTLLITFIAIATAAVVGQGQYGIRTVWTKGNATLESANTAAS